MPLETTTITTLRGTRADLIEYVLEQGRAEDRARKKLAKDDVAGKAKAAGRAEALAGFVQMLRNWVPTDEAGECLEVVEAVIHRADCNGTEHCGCAQRDELDRLRAELAGLPVPETEPGHPYPGDGKASPGDLHREHDWDRDRRDEAPAGQR